MPISLKELQGVAGKQEKLIAQRQEEAWQAFLSGIDKALLTTARTGQHTFSNIKCYVHAERLSVLKSLYPGFSIVPGNDCWGPNVSFSWSVTR